MTQQSNESQLDIVILNDISISASTLNSAKKTSYQSVSATSNEIAGIRESSSNSPSVPGSFFPSTNDDSRYEVKPALVRFKKS